MTRAPGHNGVRDYSWPFDFIDRLPPAVINHTYRTFLHKRAIERAILRFLTADDVSHRVILIFRVIEARMDGF